MFKRKRKLKVNSFVKHRPKTLTISIDEDKPRGEDSACNPSTPSLEGSKVGSNQAQDIPPFQINPELTRRRAKELYMLYFWTKDQLVEHLGIPPETLEVWLYRATENQLSWSQERDVFETTAFQKMKDRASDELGKALARSMNIMNRSLTEADLDGMKLKSPREYRDMMGVIKELKSLVNLEEGKPTSISKNINLTQKEVKALVTELQELDPFIDWDPSGTIN